jgi:serine/threonine protein kinase
VADTEPQKFGKYELLSKLATGGMAITYRARLRGAAGVTKPVVIKQILPHFADDPDFVKMFISEAQVAAGLTHSNIAQVHDFGEIDGQYFLAMELVQGQPLSKVLRKMQRMELTSMPIPLALHIASKMCDGLDYAHRYVAEDGQEMGLVHRDVSPDNVLISYEGEVKIIDFGIAKATSILEARTSPGTLKGKYPYFSTEQARGQQDLDARSDIFAAGVVLYEMVCGRRPYEGDIGAVLPRIVTADYAPPSALNPAVTPELESIIGTAMALDREDRYPTGQAFAEALRGYLYSDDPRFSPALLSQLMAWLFHDELAAEGRRQDVSPAFQEHLAVWRESAAAAPTQGRVSPVSSGSGRSATRTNAARPSSAGGRGSQPGTRPRTPGSGVRSATTVDNTRTAPVPRRNTGLGLPPLAESARAPIGRRATVPAMQTMAAPPEMLPPEPSTDASAEPASVAHPHDTPVETPIVSVATGMSTSAKDARAAMREAHEREQAERSERRQRLVLLVSLPLFGLALALALLNYFINRTDERQATVSLWISSTPEGATVKLNGKDVPGQTPLIVQAVLGEANTVVLTAPGYLAWTRRFTPTPAEPPMSVKLERIKPGQIVPKDPGPKPVQEEPQPGEPSPTKDNPTVIMSPGKTPEPTPPPVEPEPAPEPVVAKVDPDFYELDYPTRLITLRPAYNAFPVGDYPTATIELSPGAGYATWVEGSVVQRDGRGGASSTVAYFAEGDDMAADDSFGLLGPSPRVIKGARKLHVFILDDDETDNRGSLRVHLRQSDWVAPRQLVFDAEENAAVLKREHHFALRKLNPKATYLFTVRDDFAELRPSAKGEVNQVLCLEDGPKRRAHRLFLVGKRYLVTGVQQLMCTYPDTLVHNNQGAIAMDVVDVSSLPRKERAAAMRGASR